MRPSIIAALASVHGIAPKLQPAPALLLLEAVSGTRLANHVLQEAKAEAAAILSRSRQEDGAAEESKEDEADDIVPPTIIAQYSVAAGFVAEAIRAASGLGEEGAEEPSMDVVPAAVASPLEIVSIFGDLGVVSASQHSRWAAAMCAEISASAHSEAIAAACAIQDTSSGIEDEHVAARLLCTRLWLQAHQEDDDQLQGRSEAVWDACNVDIPDDAAAQLLPFLGHPLEQVRKSAAAAIASAVAEDDELSAQAVRGIIAMFRSVQAAAASGSGLAGARVESFATGSGSKGPATGAGTAGGASKSRRRRGGAGARAGGEASGAATVLLSLPEEDVWKPRAGAMEALTALASESGISVKQLNEVLEFLVQNGFSDASIEVRLSAL